mgnify:CR=1 FL=1|tara:strand:+ start:628 stop:1344 length:717 start_codon:yes stop_codon:yes gene_type:complete
MKTLIKILCLSSFLLGHETSTYHPHDVYVFPSGKIIIKDFSFYIYNKDNHWNTKSIFYNEKEDIYPFFEAVNYKNWKNMIAFREDVQYFDDKATNMSLITFADAYGMSFQFNTEFNKMKFIFYFDYGFNKYDELNPKYNFREKIILSDKNSKLLIIDKDMTLKSFNSQLSKLNFNWNEHESFKNVYVIYYDKIVIELSFKSYENPSFWNVFSNEKVPIDDPKDWFIHGVEIIPKSIYD